MGIIVIIVSALVGYAFISFFLEKWGGISIQKSFERTFDIITDGFINNTIKDKRDIQVLYESVFLKYSKFFTGSFDHYLKSYLVYLRKNANNVGPERINSINDTIKQFIDEEESNALFENVPENERKELLSLRDSLPANNKNRVFALAEMIKKRENELKNEKRINWLTIPLALIGIGLTVYFGIMTLK